LVALVFQFFDKLAKALTFPFRRVNVLNGEDTPGNLAVLCADGRGCGTEPGVRAVFCVVEELFCTSSLAVENRTGEWIVARIKLAAIGVEGTGLAEGVDLLPRNDRTAKNFFCLGIAFDDAAAGSFGDDEADGDGVEDGLKTSFAGSQSFFGLFMVVDVFYGTVPAYDLSVFATTRRGACAHPAPEAVATSDAVLDINGVAGAERDGPRGECRPDVVGMKNPDPAVAERLLLGEAGHLFPAMADVDDRPLGIGIPRNLRVELDGVSEVVFTFGEGLFGAFALGDIDDGDGDADDLTDFVACGLEGDEGGVNLTRPVWRWIGNFEARDGFAGEGAAEVRLKLSVKVRVNLGEGATEVSGDGDAVHFGEAPVDADVTKVAIEETETDRSPVVDGMELGEALGGKGLEAQRHGWIGGRGVEGRRRRHFVCEERGEFLGGDGFAVKVALTEVAAEPEEHVRVRLVFDTFGDGDKTEAVSEANNGCGDLSALSGEGHGTDEGGVDFELVEGKGLEMAEARVAGAEVVESEPGALLLQFVCDEVGELGIADKGTLGDLEDEALEGEGCLLGRGTNVSRERTIGELGERDIDGEREVRGKDGRCGESATEKLLGELADQAGFFGQGDEIGWIDSAEYRMLPASKYFEAGEDSGAELDEGLEVRNNLIVFQRFVEVELSLFCVNHLRESYALPGGFIEEAIECLMR
jgi:hypothetical protein